MVVYLSGVAREDLPTGVGIILTPMSGFRPHILATGRVWAADTGCFNHPESFDLDRYLTWLDRFAPYRRNCLFVTAPDWPGRWDVTRLRLVQTGERIADAGWPLACCAQNGATVENTPWGLFDWLFVGGTKEPDPTRPGRLREWKLSPAATALIVHAKQLGKGTHQGRVNSLERMQAVEWQGVDSADGTFLQRAPSYNIPRLQSWIDAMERQPPLFKAS